MIRLLALLIFVPLVFGPAGAVARPFLPDSPGFVRLDLVDSSGTIVEGHQSGTLDFLATGPGQWTPEPLPADVGPGIDLIVIDRRAGVSPMRLGYEFQAPGGGNLFTSPLVGGAVTDLQVILDDFECLSFTAPCRLLEAFIRVDFDDGSSLFSGRNGLDGTLEYQGLLPDPDPVLRLRVPTDQLAGRGDVVGVFFGWTVPTPAAGTMLGLSLFCLAARAPRSARARRSAQG